MFFATGSSAVVHRRQCLLSITPPSRPPTGPTSLQSSRKTLSVSGKEKKKVSYLFFLKLWCFVLFCFFEQFVLVARGKYQNAAVKSFCLPSAASIQITHAAWVTVRLRIKILEGEKKKKHPSYCCSVLLALMKWHIFRGNGGKQQLQHGGWFYSVLGKQWNSGAMVPLRGSNLFFFWCEQQGLRSSAQGNSSRKS